MKGLPWFVAEEAVASGDKVVDVDQAVGGLGVARLGFWLSSAVGGSVRRTEVAEEVGSVRTGALRRTAVVFRSAGAVQSVVVEDAELTFVTEEAKGIAVKKHIHQLHCHIFIRLR